MASTHHGDKLLEDTLKLLPELLEQRQRTLEERAQEVERMMEALENEKAALSGENKPGDVLHLNVGGSLLCVLRRTLTSVEGSMLAVKFSGRWDDSIEKDRDGNYFIDQPIELFQPMVDFLRAKACETELAPPAQAPDFGTDQRKFRDFVRMVEFYGMTSAIYPTEIVLQYGHPNASNISNDVDVTSDEWSTYILRTKGHDRQIESFEIALNNFSRAQIGWIIPNKIKHVMNNGNHLGVGPVKYSVALDCTRCAVLSDGSFSSIDGLAINRDSETVIRCEGRGDKWFVNGKLVVSAVSVDQEGVKQIFPGDWGYYTESLIPAISIQGRWHVSQVEFGNP